MKFVIFGLFIFLDCESTCDLFTLSTTFYDVSVMCNLFSKTEMRQFGASGNPPYFLSNFSLFGHNSAHIFHLGVRPRPKTKIIKLKKSICHSSRHPRSSRSQQCRLQCFRPRVLPWGWLRKWKSIDRKPRSFSQTWNYFAFRTRTGIWHLPGS